MRFIIGLIFFFFIYLFFKIISFIFRTKFSYSRQEKFRSQGKTSHSAEFGIDKDDIIEADFVEIKEGTKKNNDK